MEDNTETTKAKSLMIGSVIVITLIISFVVLGMFILIHGQNRIQDKNSILREVRTYHTISFIRFGGRIFGLTSVPGKCPKGSYVFVEHVPVGCWSTVDTPDVKDEGITVPSDLLIPA